jgi:hypothetical protein
MRIAGLTILCLALASIPAWAQWAYDNGPINGTADAWTINFGYVISDTFVAGGPFMCQGFFCPYLAFGVWEFPGDTLSSVQWSITTGENSGNVIGSGTASGNSLTDRFISTNQYGYDIDLINASLPDVNTTNGTTYWLNLQNASVASGDSVYWDENSGKACGGNNGNGGGCPSKASESAIGTIPSEAFTVVGGATIFLSPPSSCCLALAPCA